MKSLKPLLKSYRYSLAIFLMALLSLFYLYGFSLFSSIFSILVNVRWNIFLLTLIAGYLGSFSFFFPFFLYFREKRINIGVKELAKNTLLWGYFNILGKDGNERFIKATHLREKTIFDIVRLSDIVAIFLLMLGFYSFLPSDSLKIFFTGVFLLELLFFIYTFFKNRSLLKKLLRYVPASIFRYFFEFLIPFLVFASLGLNFSLSTILFFTASTSLLYYLPKFKLAGGLLDAYLVLMFSFTEFGPLYGLAAALLFRIMAVFFFVLPIKIFTTLFYPHQ